MKNLFFFLLLIGTSIQAKASRLVYYQNNQVRITQQTENCHDEDNGTHRQYIFFEIENLTDNKVEVSFRKELWYNEQCTTCEKKSDEYLMQVALEPKASASGSCETRERALAVFSKMLDKSSNSVLTKFELKNIQINIIK